MPGRPGGGGVSGRGGAARGAPPYVPGENKVLKWGKVESLDKLLQREEGGKRPLLVMVYDSTLAKDCCAANFERAIFRSDKVVKLTENFSCYKFERATVEKEMWEQFGLLAKKPAILLFDAEGGLIHKHQKCMNPQDYEKVLKGALRLNDKRVRYKKKYVAQHQKVRALMASGDYAKAIQSVNKLMKKKTELLGSVLQFVENDADEIEQAGRAMLGKAEGLKGQRELLAAYRLYREIEDEFDRLEGVGDDAGRCADDLRNELRKMGVSVR